MSKLHKLYAGKIKVGEAKTITFVPETDNSLVLLEKLTNIASVQYLIKGQNDFVHLDSLGFNAKTGTFEIETYKGLEHAIRVTHDPQREDGEAIVSIAYREGK